MKIAFFIPSLKGGGAESVIIKLANGLPKYFDVYIFVISDVNEHALALNGNVKLIVLKSKKIYFSVFELALKINKGDFDVLMTTLIYPITFISLIKPLLSRKVNLVCRVPNIYTEEIKSISSPIVRLLYRYSFSCYDNIICQSNDMKSDLLKSVKGCDNLFVINNPVMKKSISSYINNRVSGTKKYLFVGRLTKQKNILELIKAVISANVIVDIFGKGDEERYLRDYVEKNDKNGFVNFMGFDSSIMNRLDNYQALVLTSYYEGFPNVLIEALSGGLPIIAKHAPGGINEIVNDKNGVIYTGGYEELANILENFEKDNFSPKKIVEDVLDRYAIEKIVAQYIYVFEKKR